MAPHPDSIRAYGRYEAARDARISSSTPSAPWFSERLKRRTAERAARLEEARAARGPVSTVAIDRAVEAVTAAAERAVQDACSGGERADINRWNAEARAAGCTRRTIP